MSRNEPPWLQQTKEFCHNSGIKIVGWGPDLLTVEAKSQECVEEIASQLGQLGFKIVKNEDDDDIGWLNLSRNPSAVEAKIASFDISRRPWDEQIEPLIWALGALLLLPGLATNAGRYPYWLTFPLGTLSLVLFFWESRRIWGWRLETLPGALRLRRGFRWTIIPRDQIQNVKSMGEGRQQSVIVELASHNREQLGTFKDSFARNLRDRLRIEIAQRRRDHK